MPAKTFIVNFCDRESAHEAPEEIDRVEVVDGTTPKVEPAYYRQKMVETPEGLKMEERRLDKLCKKCKKDVEALDARIFGGGRTREKTEGDPDANKS
jgi:hypothetical protein